MTFTTSPFIYDGVRVNKTTYDMECSIIDMNEQDKEMWVHHHWNEGRQTPSSFENYFNGTLYKDRKIELTDDIPFVINRTNSNIQYFNFSVSEDIKYIEVKQLLFYVSQHSY